MTKIAIRTEISTAFVGVLFAVSIVLSRQSYEPALPVAILLFCMVAWIAWKDAGTFEIPDEPLILIALVGGSLRISDPFGGGLREALSVCLDAVLCGGSLLAVREAYFRFRSVDGLGFGDVKLAAAFGILVGTVDVARAVFIASVAGLVIVLLAKWLTPAKQIERLPFGAFLAPVCFGLWLLSV